MPNVSIKRSRTMSSSGFHASMISCFMASLYFGTHLPHLYKLSLCAASLLVNACWRLERLTDAHLAVSSRDRFGKGIDDDDGLDALRRFDNLRNAA